jgi:hypothetical protein
MACFDMQELEATAHQSGDWNVLQRGATRLPSLYETYYKEQGDAQQYARQLVLLFRSFAEKRTRTALGLNAASAEEFFARAGTFFCSGAQYSCSLTSCNINLQC